MSPYIGYEILAIRFRRETLVCSIYFELESFLVNVADSGQPVNELEKPKQVVRIHRVNDAPELYGPEDIRDPEVVLALLERFKRLPEGQIANDIEGREVVPCRHVNFASCRAVDLLIEFLDKEVEVFGNQRFLFAKRNIRKSMTNQPSHTAMVLVVRSFHKIQSGQTNSQRGPY